MACSMDCKIEITHHFEVLSLKALVSVFDHKPFFNTNFTRVKCSNFCTSKFSVIKSSFSALQSFCLKVHTTPHRWSSPYDAPTTFYDFCTTLVHSPERVSHRKSPLQLPILVTSPNLRGVDWC